MSVIDWLETTVGIGFRTQTQLSYRVRNNCAWQKRLHDKILHRIAQTGLRFQPRVKLSLGRDFCHV